MDKLNNYLIYTQTFLSASCFFFVVVVKPIFINIVSLVARSGDIATGLQSLVYEVL